LQIIKDPELYDKCNKREFWLRSISFLIYIISGEVVQVDQIVVANRMLGVTLIVLDMRDFDVILGMDWLAANHASIDCSRKEVIWGKPVSNSKRPKL